MSIDIYADKLQNVWLFGRSVLYTPQPIQRESVPEGWYCYDLQGSAGSPDKPHVLVDQASERFARCILSDVPLKSSRSHGELVPNLFWATAIPLTLAEHCTEEGIPYPQPMDVKSAGLETVSAGFGLSMNLGF